VVIASIARTKGIAQRVNQPCGTQRQDLLASGTLRRTQENLSI